MDSWTPSPTFARLLIVAALGAGFASALVAPGAQAEISTPIPADVPPGPPPIPSLPVATDTPPPPEAISDPLDPGAACDGWHLQSSYAGIWPTGSAWWEYECTLAEVQYPSCADLPGVMCELGYTIWGWWTDRFYWDGHQPVFLGENSVFGCEHWWDAPTAQWYAVVAPGCPVSGEPSQPPPNAAPAASFSIGCVDLQCDFDATASADADGTIVQYAWDLGDGATGGAKTAQHSYAQDGTYTIKLTVTDDDGARDSASKTVAPITGLTARGYKVKGLQKVELSWSGASSASFDVYRDGQRIAAVSNSSYIDNLNRKRPGSYSYKVCQTESTICSNLATVAF
jgi:hypothetical protein